ncbi:MAG: sigma 54-interacting transcriptional regulator [Paludibacteraceae bacterium]|nr:sigma 54-interacting transcriptional regulator [Paludibacteraceae bacterium]
MTTKSLNGKTDLNLQNAHCDSHSDTCYGKRELNLLLEISNALFEKIIDLQMVMSLLGEHLGAERILLATLNRSNSLIYFEATYGIDLDEIKSITYKLGEGIIGKVVKTREALVIPKISESYGMLNKTNAPLKIDKEDMSFICVPIRYKYEVLGTLSLHKVYRTNSNFENDERLLYIVGSMIGRAVRRIQENMEEIASLKEENSALKANLKERIVPANIKGNSGKMQEVFSLIESVSPTDATVLIRGESGVGKELVAEAIHFNSLRKSKPFIKVNCAALPESLIESELFGHEKGAFTGAAAQRIGRFEAANGGTIFLDEVGDIPAPVQVKLLRVLQQREIERLGSSAPVKVDVRIICATNRNLEELIKTEVFREDLYYRINVFPVYVPALRERINDIPALADYFIEKYNEKHGKNIKRISASAIDMLMVYHWPGNIRELENCIERACILSQDGVIRSHNLPPTLQNAVSSKSSTTGTLETIIGKLEKQIIQDALISTKGNIAKAAEKMGITERMMGIRLKKYDIDARRFKAQKSTKDEE